MYILGIESSCDETSFCILNEKNEIIVNNVASSSDLHAKFGGIIPEQAARKQLESILPVMEDTLLFFDKFLGNVNSDIESAMNTGKNNIDYISVTIGPGLIGSLLVGIETARTLSYLWNKPLIPVNHLIGHIYANFIKGDVSKKVVYQKNTPKFPLIALVVSGGHTDMVLMNSHNEIEYIGGTRDDAAGEAFDKTARIIGLPYPGGPNISKMASLYLKQNKNKKLDLFPRPMFGSDDFDFSFSGLKTAVKNYINENKNFDVSHISSEIQEAIVDSLINKSIKAIKMFNPRSFLLSGGVSANERLREKFEYEISNNFSNLELFVPPIPLCTDNASYIAQAAYYHRKIVSFQKIAPNTELSVTEI